MGKKCRICGLHRCLHCKCVGFPGCTHSTADPCSNLKYKNRSSCNTCARKKFDFKHLILPVEKLVNQYKENKENKELEISTELTGNIHEFVDIDKINLNLPCNIFTPIEQNENNMEILEPLNDTITNYNFSDNVEFSCNSMHTIFAYNGLDGFDTLFPPHNISSNGNNNVSSRDIILDQDYVHINLKYNYTSAFIIPVNMKTDTLSIVRAYLINHFEGFNLFPYRFISCIGSDIHESQESTVLLSSVVILNEFYDSLQRITYRNKYLFMRLVENENNDSIYHLHKRINFDDINIEEEFYSAPIQDQERLALNVYSSFHYNIRDIKDGKPLLIRAAYHNLPRAVNMILLSGGDINIEDNDGNTALHICSILGNYEVLSLLLDKLFTKRTLLCGRPNLYHKNKLGLIPIQVCNKNNYKCYSLLKDTMSRFRKINPNYIIFHNITRISDIRDLLNKECLNNSLLNELYFVFQGTFIYQNQEEELLASNLQTSNGFLVFLPPHSTKIYQNLTESLSSISMRSFTKTITLTGTYDLPDLHNDLTTLRTIVNLDTDKNIKRKIDEFIENNRHQFSNMNL